MRTAKRLISLLCAVLLLAAPLPSAIADTVPQTGEFVLRIEGGNVADRTETVKGQQCLRVDVYLDGVTNERLLSSISFALQFDPAQLSYVSNKAQSGGMCSVNEPEPGTVRAAFISASGARCSETTPFLTLYFAVADGLADGTLIPFAITETIKSDSVDPATYQSEKRTVGAILKPFYVYAFYGDVNCDGRVTASDAALLLRALTELSTLSEQGERNAHVTGSAALSAQDAATILRWVVKLIDRFPAEA